MMNRVFKVADKEYKLKKLTIAEEREIRSRYVKMYSAELKKGDLIPRAQLDNLLKERGIWGDEESKRVDRLETEISDLLAPLKTGGIPLAEMKERAEKAWVCRVELMLINAAKNEYDYLTIERAAEDEKFLLTLWLSLVYNDTGQRVYKEFDDFKNSTNEELISAASELLVRLEHGVDGNIYATLPENKFLRDYGFLDENLETTDKTPEPQVEFKPFITDDQDKPSPVKTKKKVAKRKVTKRKTAKSTSAEATAS